jgi:cytochrome b561
MSNNPPAKYHPWSIALHWLMLFLIAAVYLCIELRELYPRGSDMRNGLKDWHFMLGLSVWILVILRLWIRATHKIPAIAPPPVKWQVVASRLMHISLYLLMLVMPILGWLTVSYEGHAVSFFGFELPLLVSANESMAETIEEIHETIGVAGYWLIGIHALAALYHHYFIKDNTLKRILPG